MARDLIRYSGLELRHLRLIWAVAETRSLTRAASRLRLTTSALSHQLRQLEALARRAMFHREGKAMRLTGAGELLLDAAERILEIVNDTEERLGRNDPAEQQVIRLCSHCYTGYHWLPNVIRRFQQVHQNVEVRIVPELTREPFDALRDRELDLVISFNPPSNGSLPKRLLFGDELIVVIPKKHRFARKAYVTLHDLADEHLIMHTARIRDSSFVEKYLTPRNIRPLRYSGVMLTEGILEMVRAGIGVTVLARWAAEGAAIQDLVTKPLTQRGLRRDWYAVMRDHASESPAMSALIDNIREEIRRGAEAPNLPNRSGSRRRNRRSLFGQQP